MHRLLLFVAMLLLSVPAAAQTAKTSVEFDHGTGIGRLIVQHDGRADTSTLGRKPHVKIPRGTAVEVKVVRTNTALYQFTKTAEETEVAELTPLRSFFDQASPFVPMLKTTAGRMGYSGGAAASTTSSTKTRSLQGETEQAHAQALKLAINRMHASMVETQKTLLDVDAAIFGEHGLQNYSATALLALERMRTGTDAEAAAAPLRDLLNITGPCSRKVPVRIPAADDLLSSLTKLIQTSSGLREELGSNAFADDASWTALADTASSLQDRAHHALSDFEPLVASSYHVERIVALVANACSTWSAGVSVVAATGGQHVTVKVEPRTDAEIARVAERPAVSYEVTLEPKIPLEPALNVAGFAAPGASYATYATRPVTGGAEVYESGTKDQRFALGATLGFTAPGIDWRETKGIALWLPEFVVGASGSSHSVGVGPALSWNGIKVGAGALWMSRKTLRGAKLGDVLKAGTEVPLEDNYDKPQFFISLAALGFSAFGLGGK